MVRKITLDLGSVRLEGELEDTAAAEALAGRLPLTVRMSRWGEEYYGSLGPSLGRFSGETGEVMQVGDLAWWEPGNALCVFFGPTPASLGDEPRAASPVHRLGHVAGDWSAVRALGAAVQARVEPAADP